MLRVSVDGEDITSFRHQFILDLCVLSVVNISRTDCCNFLHTVHKHTPLTQCVTSRATDEPADHWQSLVRLLVQ